MNYSKNTSLKEICNLDLDTTTKIYFNRMIESLRLQFEAQIRRICPFMKEEDIQEV